MAENPTSDLTATLDAGLRGYVRPGGQAALAMRALPEYVWWKDLVNRRAMNGRYGGGFFAFFNKVNLKVEGTVARQQSYVNSEVQTPVRTERTGGGGSVELAPIRQNHAVFARARSRVS